MLQTLHVEWSSRHVGARIDTRLRRVEPPHQERSTTVNVGFPSRGIQTYKATVDGRKTRGLSIVQKAV
jgi:hypothetical protein